MISALQPFYSTEFIESLCHPLKLLPLLPKTEPIARGGLSRIYDFGEDSILKIPTEFRHETLVEAYLSYTILNRFPNLIKTHDMFVSFTNITKDLLPFYEPIVYQEDGYPTICIVQRKIKGIPLSELLKNDVLSFTDFLLFFRQIFTTMICLSESEFRISHNDLHTSNIMIEDHQAIIIDFGEATVTIQNKIFFPSFMKKYISGIHIVSGVHDMYTFCYSVYLHSKDSK